MIRIYFPDIFIQSENKNLFPPYLRFVRGVVDSEDLPLNVSRENIQHNALLEKIKKGLVSRLLKEFQNIADSDAEKYNQSHHLDSSFLLYTPQQSQFLISAQSLLSE